MKIELTPRELMELMGLDGIIIKTTLEERLDHDGEEADYYNRFGDSELKSSSPVEEPDEHMHHPFSSSHMGELTPGEHLEWHNNNPDASMKVHHRHHSVITDTPSSQ